MTVMGKLRVRGGGGKSNYSVEVKQDLYTHRNKQL